MYSNYLLNYVLCGLEASPSTLEVILKNLREDSPEWDQRTDPNRFSLREVVAHLADWEPIWFERMSKILNEENPLIKSIDESDLAIQNSYSTTSPTESLQKYEEGRKKVVALMRSMSEPQWHRKGEREGVGPMSLFEMAAMITGHDGYHALQALEYLKS